MTEQLEGREKRGQVRSSLLWNCSRKTLPLWDERTWHAGSVTINPRCFKSPCIATQRLKKNILQFGINPVIKVGYQQNDILKCYNKYQGIRSKLWEKGHLEENWWLLWSSKSRCYWLWANTDCFIKSLVSDLCLTPRGPNPRRLRPCIRICYSKMRDLAPRKENWAKTFVPVRPASPNPTP